MTSLDLSNYVLTMDTPGAANANPNASPPLTADRMGYVTSYRFTTSSAISYGDIFGLASDGRNSWAYSNACVAATREANVFISSWITFLHIIERRSNNGFQRTILNLYGHQPMLHGSIASNANSQKSKILFLPILTTNRTKKCAKK